MGLDMYLVKVDKVTDKEWVSLIGKHIEEIGKAGFNCIDAETFNENGDLVSDLKPFVRRIRVKREMFDYKTCHREHGIDSEDVVIGHFQSPTQISWTFKSGAKLELTMEEYKNYCYTENAACYIFKSSLVGYWRKYYELDDFFNERRVVENCGYYLLEEDEKQDLKEYLLENSPESFEDNLDINLLDDKEVSLFYHAWW